MSDVAAQTSEDRRASAISRTIAQVLSGLALLVLVAWLAHWTWLLEPVPGYVTMKFNTALSMALISSSLWLGGPRVRAASSTAAGILLGLTSFELLGGRDLGIDQLFVTDWSSTTAPGRMAPATATALLCILAARGAIALRWYRIASPLLLVPLALGGMAVLGYAFGAEGLYQVVGFTSVAMHTAAAILALTFAIGLLVPDGVASWAVGGKGPGARLARRTVLPTVLAILVAGLIRQRLGDAGYFGTDFGIALMVLIGSSAVTFAVTTGARRLDRSDRARVAAEGELRRLVDLLREGKDSESRRAEDLATELAEQRIRFDRAVSKMEDLIWTVEVTGDSISLVYSSPNATSVFGGAVPTTPEGLKVLASRIHPDDRHVREALHRRITSGEPAEAELRFLGFDGVTRWLWVRGLARKDGDRLFYDGIVTNVSHSKSIAEEREHLLEQQTEQVTELTRLNQLREEFLAIAGHELRTPISVIRGYGDLLESPHLSEEQRSEALGVIKRRIVQLGDLVETVFDLSRFSVGEGQLELQPVLVDALLAELTAEHRPGAEQAGIELSCHTTPCRVLADAARLRQVIDNLVSNAIKYTEPGGAVQVSVAVEDSQVVIEVADTGIGIPESQRDRVFDRLYRSSEARERKIPGTGLGLAVSKVLVDAHGGQLSLRPNEPRGTVFSVRLDQAALGIQDDVRSRHGPPAQSSPPTPRASATATAPHLAQRG